MDTGNFQLCHDRRNIIYGCHPRKQLSSEIVAHQKDMILAKSFIFPKLVRVAFISPHPDDVELCCGILIRRLIHCGIKVRYFCVTDGAPSPEILSAIGRLPENYERLTYKALRRQETIKALNILGVDLVQIKFLDYPDLECHKHIPSIVQDFSSILKNVDAVFCCPFEGGHPDHDICRFALAIAVDNMNYSGHIFEYASYNNRGYQIFQSAIPRSFTIIAETEEQKIKQQVAQIFVSQEEEAKQFKTNMECFRPAGTNLILDEYTAYSVAPYYEQFALSGLVVLRNIKEYLKLSR